MQIKVAVTQPTVSKQQNAVTKVSAIKVINVLQKKSPLKNVVQVLSADKENVVLQNRRMI